jgi:hypothetical protein
MQIICKLKEKESYKNSITLSFSIVGVAGFEPATLWSQTRCANRTALHPGVPTVAFAKVGIKSAAKISGLFKNS